MACGEQMTASSGRLRARARLSWVTCATNLSRNEVGPASYRLCFMKDLRHGVEPSVHVLVERVFLLRRRPTRWGVSVSHAGR
jgi:hypothetical protein